MKKIMVILLSLICSVVLLHSKVEGGSAIQWGTTGANCETKNVATVLNAGCSNYVGAKTSSQYCTPDYIYIAYANESCSGKVTSNITAAVACSNYNLVLDCSPSEKIYTQKIYNDSTCKTQTSGGSFNYYPIGDCTVLNLGEYEILAVASIVNNNITFTTYSGSTDGSVGCTNTTGSETLTSEIDTCLACPELSNCYYKFVSGFSGGNELFMNKTMFIILIILFFGMIGFL